MKLILNILFISLFLNLFNHVSAKIGKVEYQFVNENPITKKFVKIDMVYEGEVFEINKEIFGVQFAVLGKYPEVLSTKKNCSAHKSGLKKSDIITHINDISTKGMKVDKVTEILFGLDSVNLKILRNGDNKKSIFIKKTNCTFLVENGRGIAKGSDGYVYEGEYNMGTQHGYGEVTYPPREQYYKGDWVDGQKHGKGEWGFLETLIIDGEKKENTELSIYKGELKNGKKNGIGILVNPPSDYHNLKTVIYEGNFIDNDFVEGKVTFKFNDGKVDIYEGEYLKNLNGYGTYTFDDGSKLTGYWNNGDKEGLFKNVYPDDSTFEGHYKNDKKDGVGTFIWSDEAIKEKGERSFHLSKFSNQFPLRKFEGLFYSGTIVEGYFEWPNGDSFEGHFEEAYNYIYNKNHELSGADLLEASLTNTEINEERATKKKKKMLEVGSNEQIVEIFPESIVHMNRCENISNNNELVSLIIDLNRGLADYESLNSLAVSEAIANLRIKRLTEKGKIFSEEMPLSYFLRIINPDIGNIQMLEEVKVRFEIDPLLKTYEQIWFAEYSEDPKVREKIKELSGFLSGNQIEHGIIITERFICDKVLVDNSKYFERVEREQLEKEIKFMGSGSGFFVNQDGYIATNFHVVEGCVDLKLDNENLSIIQKDEINDIAILKSEKINTPYIFLSKDGAIKGQSVIVIGYPHGKELTSESSATKGIVSALQGIKGNFANIKIDAAIQPGNSGGPVVNEDGELVGMTVATMDYMKIFESYDSLPQNENFAIKSEILANMLNTINVNFEYKGTNFLSLFSSLSNAEIISNVDSATVYLECWSSEYHMENAGINEGGIFSTNYKANKKKKKTTYELED